MTRAFVATLAGAVAGFCTRPCCAIPAAMSLVGMSGVAVAQTAVAYRPVFLSASGIMMTATLWIMLRREGGIFNKALAATATLAGFVFSLRMLGVV